jgi:hypothetical protein
VLKTCYEKLGLAEAGYRLMGTNQATRMHHAF